MEIDKIPGRLMIEKVVLKNFKSYAGEKVIGPFHKSLTSVVGPNGSGKSNLLESLLFAFGKRARKMRLKKLSELIHHSHTHPNLTEASVEVHFLNIIDKENDSYDSVPNSKLILSRIVKKNNTSEYRLDGRTSTYEEVTCMLKYRGIDLEHNRFLILQGEVEQIAMMKPKAPLGDENKTGLLEYLEEIIGTDKYVPDIEKAEKELETIGDDVASKKMRFEEIKKVCDQLEAPMKEAVSYIETEKESYSFKCLKCRLEKQSRVLKGQRITEGISDQDRKLTEIEQLFNQKRKENESAIAEYEKKVNERENVRRKIAELQKSINATLTKDAKTVETLKLLKSSMENLEKEIEINTKRCSDINKDITVLSQGIPEKAELLRQIKDLRQAKEQEFHVKEVEIEQITQELQTKKKVLENERAPIKREMNKLVSEKDSKINEIAELEKEIKSSDIEKENAIQSIRTIEENIEKAQKELNETKEVSSNFIKDTTDKQERLEALKAKALEKNQALRIAGDKITCYEREEKKAYETKSQLSEILRAKMEKRLLGVHGRLGDLGSINSTYDIAVSTAIGGLDYIVVDTVSNGNEVINYVREKNLGKVSIIVLEKMNNNDRYIKNFTCPSTEAVRLFDQIQITDNRFRHAFYHVFNDTLFTNNIEDARRIALGEKRYKVVTKDGDIINPSGEMRGFANPTKGKMKIIGHSKSVLEVDIQAVKREYKNIQEELENINKEKSELETEINEYKKREREYKQKINLVNNNLNSLIERLNAMKGRLDTLNARSIDDMHAQVKKLQTLLGKITESVNKTEIIIKKKDALITDIDGRIEEAAGNEFRTLKAEVKRLLTEEEASEKAFSKAEATLVQRKKDIETRTKQLEKDAAELEENKRQYDKVNKERNEYTQKAHEKVAEMENLTVLVQEKENKINELEAQKMEITKQFDDILKSRDLVKQKKKELAGELKAVSDEIQKWQIKLEHTIEDYKNIERDYSNFLQGMVLDQQNQSNLEHQSRKNRLGEERSNLIRPVDWDASEAELNELIPKIKIIEDIEKYIEAELSSNRPNLNVIQEYKQKSDDKNQKENILNEAKQKENDLKTLYTDFKNKRFNEFTKGFREISEKLREMYTKLTRGGNAELEFADSTDPFSEGIVFTVRPPSKNWKKMANLSGGEKTLSSLALVFALHHYKPNSLYVMDEVDAALDFQNVSVIANYIKGETKNAQFIVVSLRYQMFEVADQLVGIYKTKDVSHSLCVSPYSLKEMGNENPIVRQTLENISMKEN
ncbi:hypothetical protein SteCoe_10164 [Stentor coeruleus]|uniref:Structural maintenance of chromosomes protein n=1 Tax=Stentor coeruleus TaxID=5963 RepID=A0A1R2CG57_9CILI|nr:hypothetical protein SteCoe_10164 [Stentor coeruleus]